MTDDTFDKTIDEGVEDKVLLLLLVLYKNSAVLTSIDGTQTAFHESLHCDQGKGDLKESNR